MTSKRSQSASTQGPSGFELENFLPYRLSVLTNTVSQGIARSYRDRHDITVTEGRYAGLTASEVVERTAMDKVAISRAVNSLVAKDLLERKTDRDDRRRRRLYVSHARGRQVLEEIVPQAREFERLLLQSLSAEEIETLERTMDALLVAARKTGEGEFPGGDRR